MGVQKVLIFALLKEAGKNYCFQCGAEIELEKDLSIEHKVPWLDSEDPKDLFFDLNNIAFSHLTCNISAARQTRELKHPSTESYKRGCRCDECREVERLRRKDQRERGIKT